MTPFKTNNNEPQLANNSVVLQERLEQQKIAIEKQIQVYEDELFQVQNLQKQLQLFFQPNHFIKTQIPPTTTIVQEEIALNSVEKEAEWNQFQNLFLNYNNTNNCDSSFQQQQQQKTYQIRKQASHNANYDNSTSFFAPLTSMQQYNYNTQEDSLQNIQQHHHNIKNVLSPVQQQQQLESNNQTNSGLRGTNERFILTPMLLSETQTYQNQKELQSHSNNQQHYNHHNLITAEQQQQQRVFVQQPNEILQSTTNGQNKEQQQQLYNSCFQSNNFYRLEQNQQQQRKHDFYKQN